MSALGKTILLSLAAHGLWVWVSHAISLDLSRHWDESAKPTDSADVWAGSSPLLEGLVDVDVQVDPSPKGVRAKSAPPPSPAADAPPPAPAPKPAPEPEPDIETEPPIAPPPPEPSPPAPEPARPPTSPSPPTTPPVSASSPQPPETPPGKSEIATAPAAAKAEANQGGGHPSAFGAVGVSRPRDIGFAFTRAVPPAAIRDRRWQSMPLGNTTKLAIDVYIDEEGHIESIRHLTQQPDRQLVSLVTKVYRLLEKSVFALTEGQVSKGRQRLVLGARIEQLEIDPDAFETQTNLSFEYHDGKGKAGVTQPGGRRITVTVEMVVVPDQPDGE